LNIITSISGYGVVEVDPDGKIVRKYYDSKLERVYGLDVDFRNNEILIGLLDRLLIVDRKTCEIKSQYKIPGNTNVHSTFYYRSCYIITNTLHDLIQVYDFNFDIVWEIDLNSYFKKPSVLNANDWTHINFALVYDDKIYCSLYRNPTLDVTEDGALLVIDVHSHKLNRLITHPNINKPHSFIPFKDGYLIASTGKETVFYTEDFENYKAVFKENSEEIPSGGRSPVKYLKGCHCIQNFEDEFILLTIPNSFGTIMVDPENGQVIRRWVAKGPLYAFPGFDPRPFQAVYVPVGFSLDDIL